MGNPFLKAASKRQNQPFADNYLATTGNAKQLLAEASYLDGYDLLLASLRLNIALRHAGRAAYPSAGPKSSGICAILKRLRHEPSCFSCDAPQPGQLSDTI